MALIGHGSQLELDTTVSGTGIDADAWVTITGVTGVDLGSDKVDTHDTTDMGTAGTKRVFIPGLEAEGDVSVKINVKPGDTTQATFIAAKGLVSFWKIVYPGAVRTVKFSGILISIDEAIPDDKPATYTAKIQITGPKTYLP